MTNAPDIKLMNFKTTCHMKKQFQQICKSKNTQMTSVLNNFIYQFIVDHTEK